MRSKWTIWLGVAVVVVIALIVVASTALSPQSNPAFDTAVAFVDTAGDGNDEAAFASLSPELQTYVNENCPDASVSACIESYTPSDWGEFLSVVFRRAAPDGDAWDVQLIATYAENEGFSGVCVYVRMEPTETGWQVTRWAGWVSCGDAASRDMATNVDAPNRAP